MGNGFRKGREVEETVEAKRAENATVLVLTEKGITTVPASVFECTALQTLNLSRNSIAVLPDKFTQLAALTSLFVNSNKLDHMPPSVSALSKLTTLSMQRNKISSIRPVLDMASLTELEMQENTIRALPEELHQLQNLRHLNLNRNELQSLPASICNITTLQSLNVTDNQLTHLPESMSRLCNLRYLVLSNNRISKLGDDLWGLPIIDTMMFDQNDIALIPEAITQLKFLSLCDIRCNPRLIEVPPLVHQSTCIYVDCPSEIEPGLFLGPVGASEQLGLLEYYKITHIVRVIDTLAQDKERFPDKFKYLWIDCLDTDVQDMAQFFATTNKFIADARGGGGCVLVHCRQGKSRSATIMLAYLMAVRGHSLASALQLCRSRRMITRPNAFFMKQLEAYNTQLGRADALKNGSSSDEVL